MYPVTELFKTYSAASDRQLDVRATIGATVYDNSKVIEFEVEDSLIAGDDFTLGVVVSSKLNLSVKTEDVAPSNAKVVVEVRFNGISGWSEWMKLGAFYIDDRNYNSGVYKYTCYDRLILSNQVYVSALEYPATMADIMDEIAYILSLTLDSSVVIDPTYTVDYQDEDITLRAMLGYIASAHGASINLTRDTEKIAFAIPSTGAAVATITASQYFRLNQTNPTKTYTRLVCTYNTDGEYWEYGTGEPEATLTFFNPHVKEAWMPTLHALINNLQYTPMTLDWRGRPELDVGDKVTVVDQDSNSLSTIFLTNKMSFKGGLKAVSEAPSYSPQKSEFDYAGELRSLIKSVAASGGGLQEDTPYYGVTIGKIYGLKVTRDDEQARVILNSDILTFQTWDSVTETWVNSLYFDAVNKKYVFDGVLSANVIEAISAEIDVVISNTIIVQNLYATMGNVARLTVNRLLTEDILDDATLMDYIDIKDNSMSMIHGIKDVSAEKVQYTDENGALLYWTDAEETQMSTTATSYPVMVSVYDNQEKMKIWFNPDDENHTPEIQMGIGDGVTPLSGKGFIKKGVNGLELKYYAANTGDIRYIRLNDDGIEMNPAVIQYSETKNAAPISVTTSNTSIGALGATTTATTRMVLNVHLMGTASTDLSVTMIVKLKGTDVAWSIKPFQSGVKDQMLFTGILPIVAAGTASVEVFLKTNTGTLAIEAGDAQAYMEIRGGVVQELPPYPVINVSDSLMLIGVQDGGVAAATQSGNNDDGIADDLTLVSIGSDEVEITLTTV